MLRLGKYRGYKGKSAGCPVKMQDVQIKAVI